MNMPRSKAIIRANKRAPLNKRLPRRPDGTYRSGLNNEQFTGLVAHIITYLPHIEERMIEVLALLMGDRSSPARQIFRSLNSEDARVKVMRALLEQARINQDKGPEFDEVIDLFVEVKKKRNAYAHGLWYTHETTGRVYIEEASTDEMASFLSQREVKLGELKATISRMNELSRKTLPLVYPQHFDKQGRMKSSPERPALRRPEEGS